MTTKVKATEWAKAKKTRLGSHLPGAVEIRTGVLCLDGSVIPVGAIVTPLHGGMDNELGYAVQTLSVRVGAR